MDYDVMIIGAGAGGMMAGIAAAEAVDHRLRIGLWEKNQQAGIKLLVCGGGRCNFTNAGSVEFLIDQFGRNGRFLTPALRHLSNTDLVAFFENLGLPSHEEHDGKIYPNTNSARSVVEALARRLRELAVAIHAGEAVTAVEKTGEGFTLHTAGGCYRGKRLIVTTGGMSYQRMGTTGDGYRFAQALGHGLVKPRPAIVGLLCREEWVKQLSGLAVPDVEVRIELPAGEQLPRLATGKPTPSVNDVLLTHFGVSGPAVLNLSEIAAELLEKFPTVGLKIDWSRHVTHEALGALLRDWQQKQGKKLLRTMLTQGSREIVVQGTSPDQTWDVDHGGRGRGVSVPGRLAEKFLELEGIGRELPCAYLSSAVIHRLVERLNATRLTIHATRGFQEAMVTAGGVPLGEVDPHTMESKITPGLFLAGEVLDLTGPSGGYNLQLAFSTGHLAGVSATTNI